MQVIKTVEEIRSALTPSRFAGKTIGFVPTMGALHRGHASLLRQARENNDIVVMSLFVNPTQFNDQSDYDKYPRDSQLDYNIAIEEDVDMIFEPSVREIYPVGFATIVRVQSLSDKLEGASRPGHFDGVATVVNKLFQIVQPDNAYFGRKDYQQLQVIRRMVRDLRIPVSIVPCETVRESDGLAMSSRNVRLTPDQRNTAVVLSRALTIAADAIASGTDDSDVIRRLIVDEILSEPLAELDYVAIVDRETLEPLPTTANGVVILIAAKFGDVRLIDNWEV